MVLSVLRRKAVKGCKGYLRASINTEGITVRREKNVEDGIYVLSVVTLLMRGLRLQCGPGGKSSLGRQLLVNFGEWVNSYRHQSIGAGGLRGGPETGQNWGASKILERKPQSGCHAAEEKLGDGERERGGCGSVGRLSA